MSFREWMIQVDGHCWATAGVSIHDLPDKQFRDMYEDGVPPSECAEEALEEEGFNA